VHVTGTHIVTVFGGTGFLGRRLVRHLAQKQFIVRAASRHPERTRATVADLGGVEAVPADIGEPDSVRRALQGAWGAVNAVSLYVESGRKTFQSIHVDAAARLAAQARASGVERLLSVSGIGSDPHSPSAYIRSRGEGDLAVQREFPSAIIVRPAVMVGPGDAFLTPLVRLLRSSPVFMMFGRGETRLQPAHVEDVAEAMARIMITDQPHTLYEFGGPQVYRYRELLNVVCRTIGAHPILVPMPFALWRILGSLAEWLPQPPLTRNQVELMEIDNVAAFERPGFASLGITPKSLDENLAAMKRDGVLAL
jgi:NADH dehydrogenase